MPQFSWFFLHQPYAVFSVPWMHLAFFYQDIQTCHFPCLGPPVSSCQAWSTFIVLWISTSLHFSLREALCDGDFPFLLLPPSFLLFSCPVSQNSQTYQTPHWGPLALRSWPGSQWTHSSESKRQEKAQGSRVKLRTLQDLLKERPPCAHPFLWRSSAS